MTLPNAPNQTMVDAVTAALLRGHIDKDTANRLLHGPFQLEEEWCPLEGVEHEFHSYPGDFECPCGVVKHHVHCLHGFVVQVG